MWNYTQDALTQGNLNPLSRTCDPQSRLWPALSTILKHGSSGPRDSSHKHMLMTQLAAHKHKHGKNTFPLSGSPRLCLLLLCCSSTILYSVNEAAMWWCKVGDRALARERTPLRVWGGGGPSVLWHSDERPYESPCEWTWVKVEVKESLWPCFMQFLGAVGLTCFLLRERYSVNSPNIRKSIPDFLCQRKISKNVHGNIHFLKSTFGDVTKGPHLFFYKERARFVFPKDLQFLMKEPCRASPLKQAAKAKMYIHIFHCYL